MHKQATFAAKLTRYTHAIVLLSLSQNHTPNK